MIATTTKNGKVKQPELAGMPLKTKAVMRAEEYLAAVDEVDIKKETAEHRKLALIGQLKADNATSVVCFDAAGAKRRFTLEILEKLTARKESGKRTERGAAWPR